MLHSYFVALLAQEHQARIRQAAERRRLIAARPRGRRLTRRAPPPPASSAGHHTEGTAPWHPPVATPPAAA